MVFGQFFHRDGCFSDGLLYVREVPFANVPLKTLSSSGHLPFRGALFLLMATSHPTTVYVLLRFDRVGVTSGLDKRDQEIIRRVAVQAMLRSERQLPLGTHLQGTALVLEDIDLSEFDWHNICVLYSPGASGSESSKPVSEAATPNGNVRSHRQR